MRRTALGLGLIGTAFVLRYVWDAVDKRLESDELQRLEDLSRAAKAQEWMQREIEREFWWRSFGWAAAFIAAIVLVTTGPLLYTSLIGVLEGLK